MIEWVKKNYTYFVAAMAIMMGAYAIIKNPSFNESRQRFNMMKRDMREIAKNGGSIATRKEVNKYGVADLSVSFIAGTLTEDVRKRNAATLSALGWTPLGRNEEAYCKKGVIYSTFLSDATFQGWNVVIMNFRYTAQTIEDCKRR